jgi:hypothetical protein
MRGSELNPDAQRSCCNSLNHAADNLSSSVPICALKTASKVGSKLSEMIYNDAGFLLTTLVLGARPNSSLELYDATLGSVQTRRELFLVDRTA